LFYGILISNVDLNINSKKDDISSSTKKLSRILLFKAFAPCFGNVPYWYIYFKNAIEPKIFVRSKLEHGVIKSSIST
jgi:hypothetical protein